MSKILIVFLVLLSACCSPQTAEVAIIRSHPVYNKLSFYDQYLVEKILYKIDKKTSNQDYYYDKLKLLLDTPTEQSKTIIRKSIEQTKIAVQNARDALSDVENKNEYINKEENYEKLKVHSWRRVCPTLFGACYRVSSDSNTDIIVQIRIYLSGEKENVDRIKELEDAAEKHLSSVGGFSVNIIFTNESGYDIFNVETDQKEWSHAYNWSQVNPQIIAHEVCHLLSLNDTYNLIESHADNKYMEFRQRLFQFIEGLKKDNILPKDGKYNIMYSLFYFLSDSQVCAISNLNIEKCVKDRKAKRITFGGGNVQ